MISCTLPVLRHPRFDKAPLRPHPVQVYLGLYTSETYPRIARKLSIWPFPRGHHRFLTRLPIKGATLLLADQRFCPMLPDQHKLKPKQGLTAVAGAQHESCSAACRSVLTVLAPHDV